MDFDYYITHIAKTHTEFLDKLLYQKLSELGFKASIQGYYDIYYILTSLPAKPDIQRLSKAHEELQKLGYTIIFETPQPKFEQKDGNFSYLFDKSLVKLKIQKVILEV